MSRGEGSRANDKQAMAARLRLLADEHSLTKIAACTETTPASIHFYLKGRTIPADFCTALARTLGVSPLWFLTGEGKMYETQVSGETDNLVSNLLSLSRAMRAAGKKRLGALAGNQPEMRLRELHDALDAEKRSREQLGLQARSILEDVNQRFRQALERKEQELARDLVTSALPLVDLCRGERAASQLMSSAAYVESGHGNRNAALRYARDSYTTLLGADHRDDDDILQAGSMYAAYVVNARRFHEAAHVCQSLTFMVRSPAQHKAELARNSMVYARALEGMGSLTKAIDTLRAALPDLSPDNRDRATTDLHIYLLWNDAISADEVERYEPNSVASKRTKVGSLFVYAVWAENAKLIDRLCKRYTSQDSSISIGHEPLPIYAQSLRYALRGDADRALKDVQRTQQARELLDDDKLIVSFERALQEAQVYRILGFTSDALKKFDETEKLLDEIRKTPASPRIPMFAIHHRNALELIPANTRNRKRKLQRKAALVFFRDAIANGFRCFNRLECLKDQ